MMPVDFQGRDSQPGLFEDAIRSAGCLRPGAKILDLPAGKGELTRWFSQQGFDPTAADIDVGIFRYPSTLKFTRADLNQDLPWEDGSFDAIFCVEGIEHVENVFQTTREFLRILKSGGLLYLTTPNIFSIKSRIRFLLSGAFSWFDQANLKKSGHINPIHLIIFTEFLRKSGVRSYRVHTLRRRAAWALPFFRAAFAIFRRLKGSAMLGMEPANRDEILLGETLVFEITR